MMARHIQGYSAICFFLFCVYSYFSNLFILFQMGAFCSPSNDTTHDTWIFVHDCWLQINLKLQWIQDCKRCALILWLFNDVTCTSVWKWSNDINDFFTRFLFSGSILSYLVDYTWFGIIILFSNTRTQKKKSSKLNIITMYNKSFILVGFQPDKLVFCQRKRFLFFFWNLTPDVLLRTY